MSATYDIGQTTYLSEWVAAEFFKCIGPLGESQQYHRYALLSCTKTYCFFADLAFQRDTCIGFNGQEHAVVPIEYHDSVNPEYSLLIVLYWNP